MAEIDRDQYICECFLGKIFYENLDTVLSMTCGNRDFQISWPNLMLIQDNLLP